MQTTKSEYEEVKRTVALIMFLTIMVETSAII